MQRLLLLVATICLLWGSPALAQLSGGGGSGGGGSGGGSGDASLAEQQTQTGILTTIDADTGNIATNTSGTASGVGAPSDAAATAGSTGSLSAKLRLMSSQLDAIKTSVELLDNAVSGSAYNVNSHAVTNAGTFATQADTELPTAGTMASGMAYPTAPFVLAANMCSNGSTLDPCLKADAGAGAVTSSTQRITLSSDDPLFIGTSNNHHLSVGTTEDETEIKATAGRLMAIQATNVAATVAFLRCANLTAANTTPGTSTIFWGMAIPGNTTGAGITAQIGGVNGLAFSTALTCWVVTGKAATDVAEVGANDVEWNIQYK